MPWYSNATLHKLDRHIKSKKMLHPIRGLVLHITDTNQTLGSLFLDFNSANQSPPIRSAHFGVAKDGEIWQFADTDDVTFAVDGVWGGDGVDNHWLSVENVAKNGEVLTDDQIDTLAQLFAWLVNTENVPSELAEHKADRGLGYHRMFGIGDHACPGTKVIAQRQDILDLANAAYT
jgi:N-acetyl-anhydromuramyl-L-alanine amidase AmpD